MSAESYLSERLQRFSIIDIALVKLVYFVFSLLIFSLYPAFSAVCWIAYLILTLLCAMPLSIHLFSQSGGYFEKVRAYIKTNNPSNQVLLFLSTFFFSLMLGTLLPILISAVWWVYVVIIIVLAIKPMTKTWCW